MNHGYARIIKFINDSIIVIVLLLLLIIIAQRGSGAATEREPQHGGGHYNILRPTSLLTLWISRGLTRA